MIRALGSRARLARVSLDVSPPAGARTSASDPIRVALVGDTPAGGRVGVTFAPGKRDPAPRPGRWWRDLGADLDALVRDHGVTLLVSLVEDHELDLLGIPALVAEAEARGLAVVRFPIVDVSVPRDAAAALTVVDRAVDAALAGGTVVFHCRGGLGRAGTMAACALVRLGARPGEAIARVRAARPGAIETPAQEAFVRACPPRAPNG